MAPNHPFAREKHTLHHRALSLLGKHPGSAGLKRLRLIFTVMLVVIYICWVKDNSLGGYRQSSTSKNRMKLLFLKRGVKSL